MAPPRGSSKCFSSCVYSYRSIAVVLVSIVPENLATGEIRVNLLGDLL